MQLYLFWLKNQCFYFNKQCIMSGLIISLNTLYCYITIKIKMFCFVFWTNTRNAQFAKLLNWKKITILAWTLPQVFNLRSFDYNIDQLPTFYYLGLQLLKPVPTFSFVEILTTIHSTFYWPTNSTCGWVIIGKP